MDQREVQAMLTYFHLYDIDCVLRPATREKAILYRYLEDGATGLIVPHVNDVETVRDLVQKVKFPPLGDRGIEANSLESNFGLDVAVGGRQVMVDHALQETFLIVQIETPQALANAEAMAEVPGLDGLFLGPSDYGLRIRHQPEAERIDVDHAMQRLAAITKAKGLAWGSMPQSTDEVRRHVELGSMIHVWGSDLRSIRNGLNQAAKELDELIGKS
jgi:2-keto-3-deoxy-L-rhamnonate aldolase RhmA